jgi:hypothetical protein
MALAGVGEGCSLTAGADGSSLLKGHECSGAYVWPGEAVFSDSSESRRGGERNIQDIEQEKGSNIQGVNTTVR